MSFSDLNKWHWDEENSVWITPRGRTTFVAMSKRFKNKNSTRPDDKGQWAVTIILPPGADTSGIRKAVNAEATSGAKKPVDFWKPGKAVGLKSPFSRADEKLETVTSKGVEVDLEGWEMIRPNSYLPQRPVVRLANGEVVDDDELDIECFSGRWARLMVKPAWYDQDGGKGVKFRLEGVQLLRRDDPIGGFKVQTAESFGAVTDEDDDEV